VEQTTTIAQPPPDISRDGVPETKPHVEPGPRIAAVTTASAASSASGWAALVQAGVALLEQLAAAAHTPGDRRADGLRFVHRDTQTGEDYLRIPMPSPQVLDQVLQTIGTLVDRFRR